MGKNETEDVTRAMTRDDVDHFFCPVFENITQYRQKVAAAIRAETGDIASDKKRMYAAFVRAIDSLEEASLSIKQSLTNDLTQLLLDNPESTTDSEKQSLAKISKEGGLPTGKKTLLKVLKAFLRASSFEEFDSLRDLLLVESFSDTNNKSFQSAFGVDRKTISRMRKELEKF